MNHAANITLYLMGWVLFVAVQAQNSIQSKTNGLATGFKGLQQWLSMHLVNLAQRAFFSGIFYGFIVHSVGIKLQAAGFPVTSYMMAGIGGWAANGLLYQIFGLIPGMRIEVADLAPPPNAQIVPPSSPVPPPSPTGAKTP
jgi:hypothetical protein